MSGRLEPLSTRDGIYALAKGSRVCPSSGPSSEPPWGKHTAGTATKGSRSPPKSGTSSEPKHIEHESVASQRSWRAAPEAHAYEAEASKAPESVSSASGGLKPQEKEGTAVARMEHVAACRNLRQEVLGSGSQVAGTAGSGDGVRSGRGEALRIPIVPSPEIQEVEGASGGELRPSWGRCDGSHPQSSTSRAQEGDDDKQRTIGRSDSLQPNSSGAGGPEPRKAACNSESDHLSNMDTMASGSDSSIVAAEPLQHSSTAPPTRRPFTHMAGFFLRLPWLAGHGTRCPAKTPNTESDSSQDSGRPNRSKTRGDTRADGTSDPEKALGSSAAGTHVGHAGILGPPSILDGRRQRKLSSAPAESGRDAHEVANVSGGGPGNACTRFVPVTGVSAYSAAPPTRVHAFHFPAASQQNFLPPEQLQKILNVEDSAYAEYQVKIPMGPPRWPPHAWQQSQAKPQRFPGFARLKCGAAVLLAGSLNSDSSNARNPVSQSGVASTGSPGSSVAMASEGSNVYNSCSNARMLTEIPHEGASSSRWCKEGDEKVLANSEASKATQTSEEVAPAFTFPTSGDPETLVSILPEPTQVPGIAFRHIRASELAAKPTTQSPLSMRHPPASGPQSPATPKGLHASSCGRDSTERESAAGPNPCSAESSINSPKSSEAAGSATLLLAARPPSISDSVRSDSTFGTVRLGIDAPYSCSSAVSPPRPIALAIVPPLNHPGQAGDIAEADNGASAAPDSLRSNSATDKTVRLGSGVPLGLSCSSALTAPRPQPIAPSNVTHLSRSPDNGLGAASKTRHVFARPVSTLPAFVAPDEAEKTAEADKEAGVGEEDDDLMFLPGLPSEASTICAPARSQVQRPPPGFIKSHAVAVISEVSSLS
jgi:hypothetical protein